MGKIVYSEERLARMKIASLGEKNGNWKGGKAKQNGYVYILMHNHPFSDKQGYVYEHRLVMEEYIGRYLLVSEHVHHINGIKDDNRIENLMLFNSNSEHIKFERSLQANIV